jgi:hypothetical protein
MNIDKDSQYEEQLKRIGRIRYYYIVHFFLLFFIVAAKFGGSRPELAMQIITPIFILLYFIDARHHFMTKCPKCTKRFYSYWRLLGLGNIRKTKCQNCSLEPLRKKNKSSYKESTGREWIEQLIIRACCINH